MANLGESNLPTVGRCAVRAVGVRNIDMVRGGEKWGCEVFSELMKFDLPEG